MKRHSIITAAAFVAAVSVSPIQAKDRHHAKASPTPAPDIEEDQEEQEREMQIYLEVSKKTAEDIKNLYLKQYGKDVGSKADDIKWSCQQMANTYYPSDTKRREQFTSDCYEMIAFALVKANQAKESDFKEVKFHPAPNPDLIQTIAAPTPVPTPQVKPH